MTIRTIGPTSTYSSIQKAMAQAGPGDTFNLESGYSDEAATVTSNNSTIFGDASSHGIALQLAQGISTLTLTGRASIDIFDTTDGNGIVGNAGRNRITVSGGADAVDGGLGVDRLIVDYRLATGAITGDSTSNFSEAGGGGRTVTITDGTIEHFTILSGSGADTITTGDGNDIIKTGKGASTVSAGQGANIIVGGQNSDTITALDGGNVINAGNGANKITSGGGSDTVWCGNGADTIVTAGGRDRITLHGGADTVDAGSGRDRLVIDYSAMTTNVSGGITGGNYSTGYTGHIADARVSSIDFQRSESFDITVGSGNDAVVTGDGTDRLSGGKGNDVLRSGAGSDSLFGGGGNDQLFSGVDGDRLRGGSGADVFIFRSVTEAGNGPTHDVIDDFKTGRDKIDFSAIDANSNRAGEQGFHFIGSAEFSSRAGELHLINDKVSGDIDGDGKADFAVEIANLAALTMSDFMF